MASEKNLKNIAERATPEKLEKELLPLKNMYPEVDVRFDLDTFDWDAFSVLCDTRRGSAGKAGQEAMGILRLMARLICTAHYKKAPLREALLKHWKGELRIAIHNSGDFKKPRARLHDKRIEIFIPRLSFPSLSIVSVDWRDTETALKAGEDPTTVQVVPADDGAPPAAGSTTIVEETKSTPAGVPKTSSPEKTEPRKASSSPVSGQGVLDDKKAAYEAKKKAEKEAKQAAREEKLRQEKERKVAYDAKKKAEKEAKQAAREEKLRQEKERKAAYDAKKKAEREAHEEQLRREHKEQQAAYAAKEKKRAEQAAQAQLQSDLSDFKRQVDNVEYRIKEGLWRSIIYEGERDRLKKAMDKLKKRADAGEERAIEAIAQGHALLSRVGQEVPKDLKSPKEEAEEEDRRREQSYLDCLKTASGSNISSGRLGCVDGLVWEWGQSPAGPWTLTCVEGEHKGMCVTLKDDGQMKTALFNGREMKQRKFPGLSLAYWAPQGSLVWSVTFPSTRGCFSSADFVTYENASSVDYKQRLKFQEGELPDVVLVYVAMFNEVLETDELARRLKQLVVDEQHSLYRARFTRNPPNRAAWESISVGAPAWVSNIVPCL